MTGTQTAATGRNSYVLGHETTELDRLIYQARFYGDLTEHLLQLASLQPGMRVLDLGCGPGDVTFLAARMVGPEGSVIGIDKSPDAIDAARRRASQAGVSNVRFEVQELPGLTLAEPVDAIVGRLILMYFPDPAALLRQLLAHVKPGGLVVFQEMDMATATSEPWCDLVETTGQRIIQTFERAGIETRCGLKLRAIFRDAGLPVPELIEGARVEGGPDASVYTYLAETLRTLLPLMERTGVATIAEVDIDTLASRLRDEALANDAVIVPPPLVGAWTRTSAA